MHRFGSQFMAASKAFATDYAERLVKSEMGKKECDILLPYVLGAFEEKYGYQLSAWQAGSFKATFDMVVDSKLEELNEQS